MGRTYIHQRILQVLQEEAAPVDVRTLAQELECSISTIRRRIKELPELLGPSQQLCFEPESGYCLKGPREDTKNTAHTVNRSIYWRNREERQLLQFLELMNSRGGFAKLFILGRLTGVSEATAFKDIRALNERLRDVQIKTLPGVGTQLDGSSSQMLSAGLRLCYSLFEPRYLVMLTAESSSSGINPEGRQAKCTCHCFIAYLQRYLDLARIVQAIAEWEGAVGFALSDLSYANLFLFLGLLALQSRHSEFDDDALQNALPAFGIPESLLAELDCSGFAQQPAVRSVLAKFIWGLEEKTLTLLGPELARPPAVEILEPQLHRLLRPFLLEDWQQSWPGIAGQLGLLRYRKAVHYPYWGSVLQTRQQGKLREQLRLIGELEALCTTEACRSWLELDELLSLLEPFLSEPAGGVEVVLVCVTGMATAVVLQRMLECYCPKVHIKAVLSLRQFLKAKLQNEIVVSTVNSKILPPNTVLLDSVVARNNWQAIQQQILSLGDVS